MKPSYALSTFFLGSLMSLAVIAAETADGTGVTRASEVAKSVSAQGAKVATPGKLATQGGTVMGKSGDNQYPSGAPVVPPKPKKEGMVAIDAKGVNTSGVKPGVVVKGGAATTGVTVGVNGDNQYHSGAPVVPPKPKKDGPEAAAAAAAAQKAATKAAP